MANVAQFGKRLFGAASAIWGGVSSATVTGANLVAVSFTNNLRAVTLTDNLVALKL